MMKKAKKRGYKYIIGVDEAGRGPLAGPVAVGAVMVPADFSKRFFRGIKDSKRLKKELRESWFSKLSSLDKSIICFSVSFVGASLIDRRGIAPAVRLAVGRCLKKLKADPKECLVLLDGSLKAPKKFIFQKTIIGGDDIEPVISMASIAAKVKRDRKMVRIAKSYPKYGFEKHKGYGTKSHCRAIKKQGPCEMHRRSFIKNLQKPRVSV